MYQQGMNSASSPERTIFKQPQSDIYMVFPYMDTDLEKLIKDAQFLEADHVKLVLYQVLKALKYLHSANIIHRYPFCLINNNLPTHV
jgi:serine/threonine protein kinase